MNKLIVLIVLILAAGAVFFLVNRSETTTPGSSDITPLDSTATTTPRSAGNTAESKTAEDIAATSTSQLKEFTVTGKNYSFSPASLIVNRGDRVKITFKNAEGTHVWKVDEFNAETKKLKAGEEETIAFVADKSGTFEYYCSIGEHRTLGMKGSLIVK